MLLSVCDEILVELLQEQLLTKDSEQRTALVAIGLACRWPRCLPLSSAVLAPDRIALSLTAATTIAHQTEYIGPSVHL